MPGIFTEGGDANASATSTATEDFITSQFLDDDAGANNDTVPSAKPDDVAKPNADQTAADKTGQKGGDGNAKDGTDKSNAGKEAKGDPNSQDLKDQQGNVIAKGGAERRWYNKLQEVQPKLAKIEQEYNTMKTNYEALRNANGFVTQFNLDGEHVALGMKMAAALRDDFPKFVGWVLTQAKTKGINIEGLAPTVDAAAIKAMISEELKPFREDRSKVLEDGKAIEEAVKARDTFYTRYPQYAPHQGIIEMMMEEGELNALEAAHQLEIWCLKNGYDFSQSLAEQKNAKEATTDPANTQQRAADLPNSRGIPNGADKQSVNDEVYANPDDDWNKIVRDTMTKLGMPV